MLLASDKTVASDLI